jgi:hypothetical protein
MKVTLKNFVVQHPQVGLILAPALARLAEQRFPIKLSYKLTRIVDAAQRELKRARELHEKLVKQYGKSSDGQTWTVSPAKLEPFNKEYDELMALDVEIWGDLIQLDDLGEVDISASDLIALSWLIKGEEETAEPTPETPAEQSVTKSGKRAAKA